MIYINISKVIFQSAYLTGKACLNEISFFGNFYHFLLNSILTYFICVFLKRFSLAIFFGVVIPSSVDLRRLPNVQYSRESAIKKGVGIGGAGVKNIQDRLSG